MATNKNVKWDAKFPSVQVGVLRNGMRRNPSKGRRSVFGVDARSPTGKVSKANSQEVFARFDKKYGVFEHTFNKKNKIMLTIAKALVLGKPTDHRRMENGAVGAMTDSILGGRTRLRSVSRETQKRKGNTALGVDTGQMFRSFKAKTMKVKK